MGTSSSKIPRPPLPIINIRLSSPPGTVFRPYSVVTGHIDLTPVAPIAPHAIEVSLFGQALIWYRESRYAGNGIGGGTVYYLHYRDNAVLFEATSNILPAFDSVPPTLESGHTYTYPFLLQFPAVTPNFRRGQYKKDRIGKWEKWETWEDGPHNLPPSFLHHDKHGASESPNYAKVVYAVCARLVCPGIGIVQGKNLHDLIIRNPVSFMPFNTNLYASQDPSSVRPRTFRLRTSALAGQGIGRRQRMRHHLSLTPKLQFEASLKLPDRMTSGSEFRFLVSLKVVSKSDKVSHIPAITIKILRLDLESATRVRAPLDSQATTGFDGRHWRNKYVSVPSTYATYSGHERKWIDSTSTSLSSVPESVTLELEEVSGEDQEVTEQATSCEAWFTARVPSGLIQSFKTFAINRMYVLRARLGIEVGGKKFKYDIGRHSREMWGELA
jgi:hypothetical protein